MSRTAFQAWVRAADTGYATDRFPETHQFEGQYIEFPIELAWAAWCAGEKFSRPSENPSSIQVCPGSPASRNEEGAVTSEVRGESSTLDGLVRSHPNALVSNPASDHGENRPMRKRSRHQDRKAD